MKNAQEASNADPLTECMLEFEPIHAPELLVKVREHRSKGGSVTLRTEFGNYPVQLRLHEDDDDYFLAEIEWHDGVFEYLIEEEVMFVQATEAFRFATDMLGN